MTAYVGDYNATDLPVIVFDLVGTIFVALVDNATVLVTLIILVIIVELTTGLISKTFGGLLGSMRRK